MTSQRGTGETSHQMLQAAHGALFVWPNEHLDYPLQLAKHLDRSDLRITSAGRLEQTTMERRFTEIVIDHAAVPGLTGRQWNLVRDAALQRVTYNSDSLPA